MNAQPPANGSISQDAAKSVAVSGSMPRLETLLDPQSAGVSRGTDWSIRKGRFSGGLSDGVEVIELCNGPLTVSILPTRGMGIWKARFNETDVGWRSPVRQPVHPQFVDLQSRNGLGWLDGFNELICRCGLSFNGPPGHDEAVGSPLESHVTLHGKIANLPAHSVEVFADGSGTGTLGVRGIVDECALFGPQLQMKSTISTTPGANSFTIRDEVTNLGSAATELELLYHTNVGPPFLEEGAHLHCPARVVAPRDARAAEGLYAIDPAAVLSSERRNGYSSLRGPTPGYTEQVYFFELLRDSDERTLALLTNRSADLGVSLHFRNSQLPCFTLWKCTQAEESGYVVGLEPATNFPNFKGFERHHGRVISLPAGETYVAELRFEVHTSVEAVAAVRRQIDALQGDARPSVHPQPSGPFCPVD